ncbi:D-alanine--poly(phosphoribitol) ligase subunit 2 [Bacillus nakamurai]|jgi:D-alanine--poly(phosphoribitol) ligase subunit 2|uniref:D-alanyl carrier protein n=1 Tax=Bacillus nakamurai TaxID=1793963 RepID=A0A150F240_9BACI|nr:MULTISPECIES: D-alanine--poly(phosphoribitol) ligase subunit 2 [Bacteria]KXZ13023.1 D-alanine--poly(phosphoribitol) ligase subunit 2 [Bacillus nakamurai]KXZ22824.1 D-alanine--poly(phosphoribitol) ligase subunit 2 [Bacillus nakamurai]MBT2634079.1 D-alanine--poly(phosphoribitol) ligase subunit 2 [Bacillus sp. ISL-26]MBT2713646.1 D-alanine--poly(phosphoribitol) ligase subunit 2 [Pseudomonas sp. ISL-88]MBY8911866.1 D-alanine--poly(phosphoribitol) ligase subunit 2 [Bacillus sp. YC2]
MEFKQEVLDVLAEVCQEDVVKENPDIDIFEEGLLDSFGTVELLVAIENRFGITVPITEFDRDEWNTPNNIVNKLTELK